MAETTALSEREKRLWRRLKGDILNVALAGAVNKDSVVREATTYLLETVGEIVTERERTLKQNGTPPFVARVDADVPQTDSP